MNLDDLEHAASEDVDDDEDYDIEEDLHEALELLEACLHTFEEMLQSRHVGQQSLMRRKEIEDLALEITAFLGLWEGDEEFDR